MFGEREKAGRPLRRRRARHPITLAPAPSASCYRQRALFLGLTRAPTIPGGVRGRNSTGKPSAPFDIKAACIVWFSRLSDSTDFAPVHARGPRSLNSWRYPPKTPSAATGTERWPVLRSRCCPLEASAVGRGSMGRVCPANQKPIPTPPPGIARWAGLARITSLAWTRQSGRGQTQAP